MTVRRTADRLGLSMGIDDADVARTKAMSDKALARYIISVLKQFVDHGGV